MDARLIVDGEEIATFVADLFRYAGEGEFVSLRGFHQLRRDVPPVVIRACGIERDFGPLIAEAVLAASKCADAQEPAVFAPPICTFANAEHARVADLASGLVLSVEIDDVDPDVARTTLEGLLGPATIVVSSGSEWIDTETGQVKPKFHIHWRLNEPTTDIVGHQRLRQARDLAARLVGADPTGKPVVHPLRWPGSWNRKGTPRMARIVARNPDAEIDLSDALDRLGEAIEAAGLGKSDIPVGSGNPQARIEIVASAMATVPNPGLDVHYDDWIRLGYAAYNATGGALEGFTAWDAWSQKSAKYNVGETEAAWRRITAAIKGTNAPAKIGAGTIFFLAKQAGWRRPLGLGLFADVGGNKAPEATPAAVTANDHEEPWPEPLDFLGDVEMTGTPELCPDHLPTALYPFVTDVAARMGVDPASVALGVIVACASVIHESWSIQPKAADYSWTENARIWGAIVGDPSILKTPVLRACTRPIDALDAQARETHARAVQDYKHAIAAWKEAGKDPACEPKYPRLDRYLIEGTTIEALTEVLREDPDAKFRAPVGKVLVRQDEMSEFFASLDRYRAGGRGGGDRGAYLRLYNGGRYVMDRVIRGSFACPNWSACFLGGVQPGPIQQIAREAADDGLLQRFIYCVPSRQERGEDRVPDRAAIDCYESLFSGLVILRPSRVPASIIEYSVIPKVQPVVLHRDAHQHRLLINDLAEAMMAMPDTSDRLKAAFGKWPGLFARLALTFHLIEIADAREEDGPVPYLTVLTEATARRTAAYMRDILLPHLLRAEAVMFSTAQTGHGRWIAGYILARGCRRITLRDVVQAYGALRAPESRRDLLDVMESLVTVGWLLPEPQPNPARPPAGWTVNPAVHSRFAERARQERESRERARSRVTASLVLRPMSR